MDPAVSVPRPTPALAINPLNPPSPAPAINPLLLASACSGYLKGLKILLNAGDAEVPFDDLLLAYASGTKPESVPKRVTSQGRTALRSVAANCDGDSFLSSYDHINDLTPAYASGTTPESVLKGVTSQGNTNCDGSNFLSSADLIYDLLPAYAAPSTTAEELLEGVTVEGDTAFHAVASNGDGDSFLSSADLIYSKAEHDILFVRNKWGDTPLHLAARAGKYKMVVRLIALAKGITGGTGPAIASGATRGKALLETENKLKETALHEAIRIGRNDLVKLLMEEDPELARFPQDDTSPLYLTVLLKKKIIAETLYAKSGKVPSYSGPNRQNTLHVAVGTCPDLTKLMLKWNKTLTTERDENGSTPLHFAAGLPKAVRGQILEAINLPKFTDLTKLLLEWNKELTTGRDENGCTPLHFAAGLQMAARSACWQLLEANPAALYQSDKDGLFPIHVAASVGAHGIVAMFVNKCPGSAGLLDAKGRTFLHVAAEKKFFNTVHFACRNRSLSWILNMRDKDGNTALHLAVQAGSLRTVCVLLMNLQVEVNLTNDKGHTPLDISVYEIPPGMIHGKSSRIYILNTLKMVGARHGASRKDHENYKGPELIKDTSSKESERIKEATHNLSIGSVLIATVAFGATFALPGGYRADDHQNGGSPTRAGRYAFDAFMMANTLSFICSTIATMGFMYSGTSMVDLVSRRCYLRISVYLMRTSISSLTTAFALGVYLVLAPVALKTAIAVCSLSSLVVLASEVEVWAKRFLILRPLRIRNGLAWTIQHVVRAIVLRAVFVFWPITLTFVWAAIARTHT